jgi:hypothetical protein
MSNKIERITKKIEADKAILKAINAMSYGGIDSFIDNANAYIKAIKQGRMLNSIDTVSKSGMSRTLKFVSCEVLNNKGHFRNYFTLFKTLGYSPAGQRSNYFRVNGCGMDMVFHTNYSIIHQLCALGFISKKECATLAQMTPSTI